MGLTATLAPEVAARKLPLASCPTQDWRSGKDFFGRCGCAILGINPKRADATRKASIFKLMGATHHRIASTAFSRSAFVCLNGRNAPDRESQHLPRCQLRKL
jgi:hypothetical protein